MDRGLDLDLDLEWNWLVGTRTSVNTVKTATIWSVCLVVLAAVVVIVINLESVGCFGS